MLIVFELLRKHGMLVQNINPYIQLLIMYPAASWGSTAPDLDRPKSKLSDRTPVNMAVERFLRFLNAKHRSWQTHCLVITGGLSVMLPVILELFGMKLGSFDRCILRLIVYGLTTGILSHLFLDALTPEGIYIIPKLKLGLVPKISFFRTGGIWEKIVCTGIFITGSFVFLYILSGTNILNSLRPENLTGILDKLKKIINI